MQINISAELLVPSVLMYVGGSNPVVFRKKEMLTLGTTMLFELLNSRSITYWSWRNTPQEFFLVSYDPEHNLMHVRGNMISGTQDYLDFLVAHDWMVDIDALSHYRLPMPRTGEAILREMDERRLSTG